MSRRRAWSDADAAGPPHPVARGRRAGGRSSLQRVGGVRRCRRSTLGPRPRRRAQRTAVHRQRPARRSRPERVPRQRRPFAGRPGPQRRDGVPVVLRPRLPRRRHARRPRPRDRLDPLGGQLRARRGHRLGGHAAGHRHAGGHRVAEQPAAPRDPPRRPLPRGGTRRHRGHPDRPRPRHNHRPRRRHAHRRGAQHQQLAVRPPGVRHHAADRL